MWVFQLMLLTKVAACETLLADNQLAYSVPQWHRCRSGSSLLILTPLLMARGWCCSYQLSKAEEQSNDILQPFSLARKQLNRSRREMMSAPRSLSFATSFEAHGIPHPLSFLSLASWLNFAQPYASGFWGKKKKPPSIYLGYVPL